jgi:hypothetical protein
MEVDEIDITSPFPLPDNALAFIYERTGLIADVKYGKRGLVESVADVVAVWVAAPFLNAMIENFGAAAATRLKEVFLFLCRRRRTAGDTSPPPGERPVELQLVVTDAQVVFVVDVVAAQDDRAMDEMLRTDVAAYRRGTTLRWDVSTGRWRSQEA